MAALPDYLPILCVPDKDLPGEVPHLDHLVEKLTARGLGVSVLAGSGKTDFQELVEREVYGNDLVIITGETLPGFPCLKFKETRSERQLRSEETMTIICSELDQVEPCLEKICAWLEGCVADTPVWACLLIGGKSSRMGRPKQLLRNPDGRTWLEHSVSVVEPVSERIVLSGKGIRPDSLVHLELVEDLPGIAGPLAGLGAVMQHRRFVSWLVVACDLPDVDTTCLSWLLDQRRPAIRAIIPRNPLSGMNEPLLAWYDFRCRSLIGKMIEAGVDRIGAITSQSGVHTPLIPDSMCGCWRNVNSPEDLQELY